MGRMKSPLRVIAGKKLLCQAHEEAFLPRMMILPMLGRCGATIAQYQRSQTSLRPSRANALRHPYHSENATLAALFLLAFPHPSFAGSVTWPSDGEVLSLGPHLEYLVDPTGSLELRDAQTSVDAWTSVTQETVSFGYTSDVYWFRTTLPATVPDAPSAFLHIGYPLLDEVDFYELEASSSSPTRTISVGDRQSFDERPHSHRHFLFDVAPSNTAREIYFRVKTTSSMTVPLTISTQATFHTNDDALTMAFGLLFGGMLLMILYNVILYGWTRDTNYLMYCGYAGCLVVFFAAFQGFRLSISLAEQHLLARI